MRVTLPLIVFNIYMSKDDINLLLTRYITNQASDKEIQEVKEWLALHPENELYFVEMYEAWQNMLYNNENIVDEDAAYDIWKKKISNKKTYLNSWLYIAALLILIASAALIFYPGQHAPQQNTIAASKGTIKKIVLKDGTQVWLNAGSVIEFDSKFGITNRNINLKGEALFDIGHRIKTLPFIIKAQNYIIRDIGTRFNVKAYPGDKSLEAVVLQGEIAVEDNAGTSGEGNMIYVKKHQLLKINGQFKSENKADQINDTPYKKLNYVQIVQIDSLQTDLYEGWKDDLLVFDNTSFADMAKVLERRYNVNITFNNQELKDIRYSGSFKGITGIEKALSIIRQNTPIKYQIHNNNILLTKAEH